MADNVNLLDSDSQVFVAAADFIGSAFYQRVKIAWGVDGAAVDASATNPFPVTTGTLVQIANSKTRPNDANTYAAGDVINESTSAGTVYTFTGCARAVGGSGIILSATLDDSANQTLKLQAELWLYSASPASTGNDNAAFAPADNVNPIAVIPIGVPYVGNAAAAGSGNVTLTSGIVNQSFLCAADANLYGVLVARNAYIPINQEVFNIRLLIAQD